MLNFCKEKEMRIKHAASFAICCLAHLPLASGKFRVDFQPEVERQKAGIFRGSFENQMHFKKQTNQQS